VTHLDTSFLVDLLRERSRHAAGPATRLLETLIDEELAISIHVVCELRAGAERSRAREAEHGRVTALCSALRIVIPDDRFALEYGRLLGELERRGQPIATMDLMIAAAARVENAPLVTRNVRNFERVPGLDVIAY
jgi:tRNA(fMet)-specific endonuclease VapC